MWGKVYTEQLEIVDKNSVIVLVVQVLVLCRIGWGLFALLVVSSLVVKPIFCLFHHCLPLLQLPLHWTISQHHTHQRYKALWQFTS